MAEEKSKKEEVKEEAKKPAEKEAEAVDVTEPKEDRKEDSKEENTKKEDALKKQNFLQSVGRRKRSIARVKVFKNGSGKVMVNGKDVKEYFGTDLLVEVALGAINNVSQLKKLDISVKVVGGGMHGQAEAIRLGTAKSLLELNPVFKKNLRKAGFLTRDSRRKERKKPGLKKARRAPQWSKR